MSFITKLKEHKTNRPTKKNKKGKLKMAIYAVTIRATVTKTYEVEANSEQEAIEDAHGIFSVLNDDTPERYEEETLRIEKKGK